MKVANKISMVVLKILEIVHWIGAVSMIVAVVLSLLGNAGLERMVDFAGAVGGDAAFTAYGFEVSCVDLARAPDLKAVALFAVGGTLIFALMAMVFRNAYLIIRRSQDATPFQKDNLRMVREIGIFTIAVPVVALIMSWIIRLAFGGGVETSVRFDSAVIGIVALALSNAFAYGMELQSDVDGLL